MANNARGGWHPTPITPRTTTNRTWAVAAAVCGLAVAVSSVGLAPAAAQVSVGKSVSVSKNESVVTATGFTANEAVVVTLQRNGLSIATSTGVANAAGRFEVNEEASPTQCWDAPATPEILPGDHVVVAASGTPVADVEVSDIDITDVPVKIDGNTAIVTGEFFGGRPPIEQITVSTSNDDPDVDMRAPGDGTLAYDGPTGGAFTATFDGLTEREMNGLLQSENGVKATHRVSGNEETVAVLDGYADQDDDICPAVVRRGLVDTSALNRVINQANVDEPFKVYGDNAAGDFVQVSITGSGGGTEPAPVAATAVAPTRWEAEFPAGSLAGLGDGTVTVSATYTVGGTTIYGSNRRLQKDTVAPLAPTMSPTGGVFIKERSVWLGSPDSDVYYTTDGTSPVDDYDASFYEGPFAIARSLKLRAVAVDRAGNYSAERGGTFTRATASTAPRIRAASPGRRGRPFTAIARWAAPVKSGGVAIRRYEVTGERIHKGRVVQRRTFARPAYARATQVRLARGTWRFHVRAVNAAGKSRYSTWSRRTVSR